MIQQRNVALDGSLRSIEGLANLASVVLALLALVLVPWPGVAFSSAGRLLLLWGALEGAFLLPLLPDLLAGSPLIVRATMREAQTSVIGRALLWLALGVGPSLGSDWSLGSLPAHVLALLAAVFALPAALVWGPFGAVPGFNGDRAVGLDAPLARLLRLARRLRSGVLVVATLALLLPIAALSPIAGLSLLVGALLLVWLAFGRLTGYWPQLTLPAALRLCWMRALPLGLAAIIYVVFLELSRR